MYEAALTWARKAEESSRILAKVSVSPKQYILATVHRAENTDSPERLQIIVDGLALVAKEFPVVVPLHPRTRRRLGMAPAGVTIIEPVGYLDMSMLERNALVIATDSGGVQKEAFFHRVPCAILRGETEWTELVDLGWSILVPPVSPSLLAESIRRLVGTQGRQATPYGDGSTSRRILAHLSGAPASPP
jgi:UDP-GlcNAc3NAcA epimerase